MKTLRYIVSGIMLCFIISFCNAQITVKNEQVFTLQSISKNTSKNLLSESKNILQKRLQFMNLQNFQVIQNDDKPELVITLKDTIDHGTLLDILLIPGHLNFYETTGKHEVLKYFGNTSSGCVKDAFTSMHVKDSLYLGSESILGIAHASDTGSINACLNMKKVSALLPKNLKLLWAINPVDDDQFFLYCISSADKTFNEQNILEAHADYTSPEHPALCITFKEKVWKLLENTTLRNVNKTIVLVIDNKVYFAPRIQGEIPHGKISLTGGGLSKTEVRKLVAIISNGALPLKLKVVSNN